MAKNKKRKGTPGKNQTISPKKYIQTKARKLPILGCYINEDWETSKLAQIFIARRHINGNITFGGYLTDLLGRGVKDAVFNYNIPSFDFDYLLEEAGSMVDHDIKSHKDWEISQYILEEDTEDIPLMDLEFGINGKPVLFANFEDEEENSWDEDEELEDEEEDFLEEEMIRKAQKLVYTSL